MWVWNATLECGHQFGGSNTKAFTTPVEIGDEWPCGSGCGTQKVVKTWGRGR